MKKNCNSGKQNAECRRKKLVGAYRIRPPSAIKAFLMNSYMGKAEFLITRRRTKFLDPENLKIDLILIQTIFKAFSGSSIYGEELIQYKNKHPSF